MADGNSLEGAPDRLAALERRMTGTSSLPGNPLDDQETYGARLHFPGLRMACGQPQSASKAALGARTPLSDITPPTGPLEGQVC